MKTHQYLHAFGAEGNPRLQSVGVNIFNQSSCSTRANIFPEPKIQPCRHNKTLDSKTSSKSWNCCVKCDLSELHRSFRCMKGYDSHLTCPVRTKTTFLPSKGHCGKLSTREDICIHPTSMIPLATSTKSNGVNHHNAIILA